MIDYVASILPYALLVAAVIFGLYLCGRAVWDRLQSGRGERTAYALPPHREPTEEDIHALLYSHQQEMEDRLPRCPCGDVATHAAPRLVRERSDGRQEVYASAPRYRRVVPKEAYLFGLIEADTSEIKPELCEAHAHMADSEMDQFIFTDIRAKQARLNQEIASRASEFETEKLMQRIRDNLTEEQKRKVRQLESKNHRRQLKAVNGELSSTNEG